MRLLWDMFGSGEKIWKADLSELKNSGLGEKLSQNIFFERKKINPEEEWDALEKEEIKIIPFFSADYPALLKESPYPPALLYIKGALDLNTAPAIAIVGARKCSEYGKQVAYSFSRDLTRAGITIVSGMAFGIDSAAHQGALDASGKTIAVLGNSLDDENIYPANNLGLSREIAKSGALLSEYPPKTQAGKITFPARNRIIAGVSLGTLVVEAGEKSGALLTAKMALEANREIFSIPGPIFSEVSRGTNSLIQSGAKTVTSIKDVLEELNLENSAFLKKEKGPKPNPSSQEKIILKILSTDPVHIDKMAKLAKLQTAEVAATLSMMEIKGWTKNIGGQNYILL